MRKAAATLVAGLSLALFGTALASASDDDDRAERRPAAGFELEIDPELDAQFGPRQINAVQAAAIVEDAFPGAEVIEAELDEENGGPIWEVEFVRAGRGDEVSVDADTGAILSDD